MAKGVKGFQPGNQAAVGNRGPSRPDIFTQALISQLHEVDKKTSRVKLDIICEQLVKAGMAGEVNAIKEMIDRVQGRANQSIDMNVNADIKVEGGLPS